MCGIQPGESWDDDITVSNPHKHTLETRMRSRCCVTPMKVQRYGRMEGEDESEESRKGEMKSEREE